MRSLFLAEAVGGFLEPNWQRRRLGEQFPERFHLLCRRCFRSRNRCIPALFSFRPAFFSRSSTSFKRLRILARKSVKLNRFPLDLFRPLLNFLFDRYERVEHHSGDEAASNCFGNKKKSVDENAPEFCVVVEKTRRNHHPHGNMVNGNCRGHGKYDRWIGVNRKHCKGHKQIEVHLDLHWPLPEVNQ